MAPELSIGCTYPEFYINRGNRMNAVIEQAILNRLYTLDDNRLAEVLDFVEFIARRERCTLVAEQPTVKSLRGKYRNLMSSSETFASRKAEEINLEEQHLDRRGSQFS
jgi:hypothetical protein